MKARLSLLLFTTFHKNNNNIAVIFIIYNFLPPKYCNATDYFISATRHAIKTKS